MVIFSFVILLIFLVNSSNTLDKVKDCKCRILPESKIVGGEKAHHLSYPWIISLSQSKDETPSALRKHVNEEVKINSHACGGSIINEYWILTAAHCVAAKDLQLLYVGSGNDNDLVKIFEFGRIESVKTIIHPFYKNDGSEPSKNDIALVKLKEPIQFSNYVKPACFLKEQQKLYTGVLSHAGWGSTEVFKFNVERTNISNTKISRNLKEMFLTDQSDNFADCRSNENKICAKGVEEGESSCKGDSGGPIHYTKNGKSYVVGLTSYGAESYIKNDFIHLCVGITAYTKVSNYMDWIQNYVDNDICDF